MRTPTRFPSPRLRLWLPLSCALAALVVATLGLAQDTETPAEAAVVEGPASSPTAEKPLEYETWKTVRPGEHEGYNRRAVLIQRGHAVYNTYCVGCHGDGGDGNGPATARLITKPRDFRSGIYKFRSTDSGSLPLEADLYRTITRGLSRVSMPAFPLMPEGDKLAVIEYIKGFYTSWDEEKDQRRLVHVPNAPLDLDDEDRIPRGRFVYLEMACSQCHGVDGQGTGATQTEYVDAWGNKQKAFNFTRGSLKGGNSPEDIYRTFHTGLRSVMPSYGGDTLALAAQESFEARKAQLDDREVEQLSRVMDQFPATVSEISGLGEGERLALATRNSWDLVAYIRSLRTRTSTAKAVLGSDPGGER